MQATGGTGAMGFPPLPTPFPPKRDPGVELQEGEIAVRFIGTADGVEKVVGAKPGAGVIAVAAKAGIKIPTACRSGLCGTCTTDLEDPTAKKTYRPGYTPIRTCVAKVALVPGCEEMVLDVYRSSSAKNKISRNNLPPELMAKLNIQPSDVTTAADMELPEAMERFGENWENDFLTDSQRLGSSTLTVDPNLAGMPTRAPNYGLGLRTTGASLIRSEKIDEVINKPRSYKRYDPNPVEPPPPNPMQEFDWDGLDAVRAARYPERKVRIVPPHSPEDRPQTVGIGRYRSDGYRRAAIHKPQKRFPKPGEDPDVIYHKPKPRAAPQLPEPFDEQQMIARDYSKPYRKLSVEPTVRSPPTDYDEYAAELKPLPVAKQMNRDWRKDLCKACSGTGRVPCYNCDAKGMLVDINTKTAQLTRRPCPICIQKCTVGCSECQGTGIQRDAMGMD